MMLGGFRWRFPALGLCLLCVAVTACGDESPPAADVRAVAGGSGVMVEVGCREGGPSPQRNRRDDLPIGPFVLIDIDESAGRPRHRQVGIDRPPDAFGGPGYKGVSGRLVGDVGA